MQTMADDLTHRVPRVGINIKASTKLEMDKKRLPGQSYDGFIRQMMARWATYDGGR